MLLSGNATFLAAGTARLTAMVHTLSSVADETKVNLALHRDLILGLGDILKLSTPHLLILFQ